MIDLVPSPVMSSHQWPCIARVIASKMLLQVHLKWCYVAPCETKKRSDSNGFESIPQQAVHEGRLIVIPPRVKDHPAMLHIRFRFLACKVVSFGRSHASHLQGLSNRVTKIGLRPIFPRQGWAHHTIFKRFIGGDLSTSMTSVLQENRSENLPGPIEKKQKKADPVITTLRVKKLSVDATLPTRGSEKAAGYDLSRYTVTRWPLLHVPSCMPKVCCICLLTVFQLLTGFITDLANGNIPTLL